MLKTIGTLLLFITLQNPLIGQSSVAISAAEISFVFLSNTTEGSISGFSSSSSLDIDTPENSVFQGSVKAETIETGNFLRNWSLRGSKYFDVDTYPDMRFASTSVAETEAGYAVKGNLTIKDISKPITINFTRDGNSLIGSTTLFASDFGIQIKKKREDNKVSVKMVFTLD